MIKKYKHFLNEKLSDKLSGFDEDGLRNQFLKGEMSLDKYINIYKKYNLNFPIENDIKNAFLNKRINILQYFNLLKENNFNYPPIDDIKQYFLDKKITFFEYTNILIKFYNISFENDMNEFYYDGLIDATTYLYFCIKYHYKLPSDDEINKLYLNNEIPDYIYNELCKNHKIKKLPEKILFDKIKTISPDLTLMNSVKNDILYGVKQVFNEASKEQKNSALIIALNNNNYKIFKYLVEHGVDIHDNGEDLLLEAIKNNNFKIVKLLVEHGADIHINKERPLYWACINDHYEIFKLLVEHGAQITNDIVKCAYKNNNRKIINIIQNYDKEI